MIQAGRETPFAPSSIGRTKPKSGRVIPDEQFGFDSNALYDDITHNVKLQADSLTIWSDLDYAAYIMGLYATKGPFAPESILFTTDQDSGVLIDIINELVDESLLSDLL